MLLSLLPGCGYHVTSHLQLLLLFLHCWDGPYPQLWTKINPSFWDCSYPGFCHNQKSNTQVLVLSISNLLRTCTGSVMTQDRKKGSRAGSSSYGRSDASQLIVYGHDKTLQPRLNWLKVFRRLESMMLEHRKSWELTSWSKPPGREEEI